MNLCIFCADPQIDLVVWHVMSHANDGYFFFSRVYWIHLRWLKSKRNQQTRMQSRKTLLWNKLFQQPCTFYTLGSTLYTPQSPRHTLHTIFPTQLSTFVTFHTWHFFLFHFPLSTAQRKKSVKCTRLFRNLLHKSVLRDCIRVCWFLLFFGGCGPLEILFYVLHMFRMLKSWLNHIPSDTQDASPRSSG